MSIEKQIEGVEHFLRSESCIFLCDNLHFPNQKQQRLISAFFHITNILNNSPQPQKSLQELLVKSINNLKPIVLGLIYISMLQPARISEMFGYIKLLRNQGIKMYADVIRELLAEQFETLKPTCYSLFPNAYFELFKYRLVTQEFTLNLLKSVNFSQLVVDWHYASQVLEMFEVLISSDPQNNIKHFGRYLWIKSLRIYTSIYNLNQPALNSIKQRSWKLINSLWEKDKQECLACGSEAVRFLFEIAYNHQTFLDTMTQYISMMLQQQSRQQWLHRNDREKILAVNIPQRTHKIILFALDLQPHHVLYHMNWLRNSIAYKRGAQIDYLLLEILRYVVKCVETSRELRFFIIEWILNSLRHTPCFDIAKHVLFFDFFYLSSASDDKVLESVLTPLRVVDLYRMSYPSISDNLLEYLLFTLPSRKNLLPTTNNSFSPKTALQRILILADKKKILNIQALLSSSGISPRIKTEVDGILKSSSMSANQQYDPFGIKEQTSNKSSNNSPDLVGIRTEEIAEPASHTSNMWIESQDSPATVIIAPQNSLLNSEQKQQVNDSKLSLKPRVEQRDSMLQFDRENEKPVNLLLEVQKEFVEECTDRLPKVLQNPTKENYIKFLQLVIVLIKKLKYIQDSDTETTVNMYIRETCKVSYAAFMSHFELFHKVAVPENIFEYLIKRVVEMWGTNAPDLQIIVKVIRLLQKHYEQATNGAILWVYFDTVAPTKANSKSIIEYLIGKNNIKKALLVADTLSNQHEILRKRAKQYFII